MVFDEAGTYQIEYTATDECGNTTNAERTVIVEAPPTYRTVLYTDGTFIINESSRDEAANVALHGQPANVYDPFDPNGATNFDKYIFASASNRTWNSQASSIKSVEIGSNISPTSTAYWFFGFTTCTTMNLSLLNTSAVTTMKSMFESCQALTTLDVSGFNTNVAIAMDAMFSNCNALTALDVTNFNTSSVGNMGSMFNGCNALASLDVSHFDTSAATNMSNMFNGCYVLTALDLSGFNTSAVTNMRNMFTYCRGLVTIYASSNFIVTQVTNSSSMFANMRTNLVGGAGTVWSSSNPTDKTYAHIDGGVSDPGYFTARS